MRTYDCCLAWLLLLAACGGGSTQPSPKSAAEEPDRAAPAASTASRAASDESSEAEEPRAAAGARCDDGTCTVCGSGICPSGWYCDEKAGACSWLAECAAKPSCGCITRVLGSACKCDGAAGGPKVSCD